MGYTPNEEGDRQLVLSVYEYVLKPLHGHTRFYRGII